MKAKLFMKEKKFTGKNVHEEKIAQKFQNSHRKKIVHVGKKIF